MITAKKAKILASKSQEEVYTTVSGAMALVEKQARMGFGNTFIDTVGTSAESIFKAFKKAKFRTFISKKGDHSGYLYASFKKGKFPKLDKTEAYTIEVEW